MWCWLRFRFSWRVQLPHSYASHLLLPCSWELTRSFFAWLFGFPHSIVLKFQGVFQDLKAETADLIRSIFRIYTVSFLPYSIDQSKAQPSPGTRGKEIDSTPWWEEQKTFWPSVILHKSSELCTVIIHTFKRRKLRLRKVSLILRVIQFLIGLSSSLDKFDSRAGAFLCSDLQPSGFRPIRYISLSTSEPVLEGGWFYWCGGYSICNLTEIVKGFDS